MLFRVDGHTKVTKIMDISSRRELHVIQPPKYEKLPNMRFEGPDFVESCGEILSVCYNQSFNKMDYKFYIHRLEFGNGKGNPCWVKLRNIGDRILFFDLFYGTGCGFYLKASDFVGFNGNCIYFTNSVCRTFGSGDFYKIFMYDIENGETILIDSPFDRVGPITWFMLTITHV
ncbi:F-box protein [Carex littledalei]|uniref:F-box protein n=1 Tax=Carex littledalei TaxID=544730 RepID=A0A833RP02_9POAL|nr:F-box protein [Carex littledalei]